jgi:hypothetical protein
MLRLVALLILLSRSGISLAQELGPADFPASEVGKSMPETIHDAYCRQLGRECRIRFKGVSMSIDGYNGITRDRFLGFRSSADGEERYFYVRYLNSKGQEQEALFLFVNWGAASEFGQALARWYEQDARPRPNFRFPSSQGPQDTQGR